MSVKMRNFTLFSAALVVLFLLTVSLSTCDSPLGFGDPIDWEAPVLTIDPGSNPRYVGQNTKLEGDVSDNVSVDRVILRDAITGEQLFRASLHGSNPAVRRWAIDLEFTEEQNNEKLAVEIVAFDRAGNSGERSIVAITLIIDIRSPIVEDMWIQRTDVRRAELESYHSLKDLERTDLRREVSDNADKYQNGVFYIQGEISEEETRINNVSLNIYDINRDPNTALLELPLGDGANPFAPKWLINEEDLLSAGEARWPGYTDNYYNDTTNFAGRYYYRVAIRAYDSSENETETENFTLEDLGHFVMWEKADVPMGIVDPLIGAGENTIPDITPGAQIPVEFFDDDRLLWAYTGLLTALQWEGTNPIASGVNITGSTDEQKLAFLKDRLRSGQPVYNWRYDRYSSDTSEEIKNLFDVGSKLDPDDTLIMIQTGSNDQDNGKFVLFTLAADEKLDPHPAGRTSPATYTTRERMRHWTVNIADQNRPLIVLDTVNTTEVGYDSNAHLGGATREPIAGAQTGDSPRENTFPRLSGTPKQYFELNGYMLRPNKKGSTITLVKEFRIAWIPAGLGDSYINDVQDALQAEGYPNAAFTNEDGVVSAYSMNQLEALGVQHWDFAIDNTSPSSYPSGKLVTGTPQGSGGTSFTDTPTGGPIFTKQAFRKKFDVLGGQDDLKTSYKNFTYNGNRENDTKLFIIYAKDDVGHVVFRDIRLLGNTTPPTITVYDLSNRTAGIDKTSLGPQTDNAPGLPDLNNTNSADGNNYYFIGRGEAGKIDYLATRLAYQPTGFSKLQASGALTPGEVAQYRQVYPPKTFIKYWATAQSNGDLAVESITLREAFYSPALANVGHYDDNVSLSYVEYLSDGTQRTLQFTATDSLGNTATVTCNVSITNAAILQDITTTSATGTYGIGQKITLRANYSNRVSWSGTNPPLLNVRYKKGSASGTSATDQIIQIPLDRTIMRPGEASLSLPFTFEVEENDTGILETLWSGIGTSNGNNAIPGSPQDRPITLPSGTQIRDVGRNDLAFTPGYSTAFTWTSAEGSLQEKTLITLNGVRPRITSFAMTTTKAGQPYTTPTDYSGFFFRDGETIEFTLKADKPILIGSATPRIQFRVTGDSADRYAAWFKTNNTTTGEMVFSVQVGSATTPTNGRISAISLDGIANIVDSVGNQFPATGTGSPASNITITNLANQIFIDRTPPTAPTATLAPGGGILENGNTAPAIGSYPTQKILYNRGQTLTVTGNGGESAPVTTEYSTNGGVSWASYSSAVALSNGEQTLQARLTDRAGNVGAVVSQLIHVNAAFPNLIAVNTGNPSGWYRAGRTLTFTLDFAEAVRVQTAESVQIVLTNRGSTFNQNGTGQNNVLLSAAAGQTSITRTNNTTITFTWPDISGKEMRDGMYISCINLSGLRDRFGNAGPAADNIGYNSGTPTIGSPFSTGISNLSAGVKVDAIVPEISSTSPASGGLADTLVGGSDYRNKITLTFSEPVMRGSGIITIKPEANFLIPPVLENNGYYLNYSDDSRSSTSVTGANTWVAGFYDIYNSGLTAAQRNALAEGTTVASQNLAPSANNIPSSARDDTNPSMSRLRLNNRTGQTYGPYIKTTHGLTPGNGYTGNYSGTTYNSGPNTNQTGASHMIPDIATKWVLDYQYSITGTSTTVSNIRDALIAAKFRWQEIEVVLDNVEISGELSNTVTITLTEPLLKGLQWELSYPAGTFTDAAGNNAVALDNYTFWSPGAQKPVIRVDRKSFDARTSNWHVPTTANNTSGYTYGEPAANSGWGLADFNTVNYRIESETPGASIYYGTSTPANSTTTTGTGPFDAVTGAWTGNVANVGTPVPSGYVQVAWNSISTSPTNDTANQWVRPNLIYRAGNDNSYTVNDITRRATGALALLRSYNRDATTSTLEGLVGASPTTDEASTTSSFEGSFSFGALEAGKRYVAAVARKDHGDGNNYYSARGYEGAFRTLIMLYYSSNRANNYRVVVQGSNIKNGMPSIPGFPVQDAPERGDSRFVKMFNRNATNNPTQFIWVSTEIVSEWYFLKFGGGNGSHMNVGETNNYLMVSYGDLTFGRNITSSGE